MSARLKLADGSSWPAPDIGRDDHDSLGWRLTYAPDSLTRSDHLQIASYLSTYNYLFEPSMTVKAMGNKVAMLRRAYREQERGNRETQ